jgi:ribose transport system ATP-binding protein
MTDSGGVTAGDQTVLSVSGVDKRFPGVHALKRVSFDCRSGEIHGLVGENGAGKSTLMRVLSGVHRPDFGSIRVRGREVALTSPRVAHDLGIAMVYQDTRLIGELEVAQNIWLEREPGSAVFIDRAEMARRSAAILGRLGVDLDLRRKVRELSVSERQIVEIARALTAEPAVLILDEPTSSLDPAEIERLVGILRVLRATGTGIVFISHRLTEVMQLTDRITVMKDGSIVSTVQSKGITQDFLVRLMVGRELSLAFPPRTKSRGPTRLEIQNLSCSECFEDVSLTAAAGEIVGLGGIQGNGQREVVRALFGLRPAVGEIRLDGAPIHLSSPGQAVRAGIVYLPGDRRAEGLFIPHSVRKNIAIPHLRTWSKFGILLPEQETSEVRKVIDLLQVRTPSDAQPVGWLSGGNQQKVMFGRWLPARPSLYLFEEPTQGVDVATKLELYRVVRRLADEGAAVLLLSSDLLELIGLSDRIVVFARGRVVDRIAAAEATEERIVGSAIKSASGSESAVDVPASERFGGKPRERSSTFLLLMRRYGGAGLLLCLIVLLGSYTATQTRYFLTERNLGNLLLEIAPLALVAIGQTAVILIGGIDLSVGPLISLTTAVASYALASNSSEAIASGVVLCLAVGVVVGALNGFIILRLGIPDLISTLSTFSIVTGLALTVRPSPGGSVSETFSDAMTLRIDSVPVVGALTLLLGIAGEIFLLRGRIGTRLYAIGSNIEAAFIAGIPVGWVRFLAYLFCGFMAALAGLVIAARIGSGDPQSGSQFTLASITAVVVGGTSIFGGRGTMIGTLLGAVFVVLMQNSLNQLHVTAYYQYIWTGALMLLAVAAYSIPEGTGFSKREK